MIDGKKHWKSVQIWTINLQRWAGTSESLINKAWCTTGGKGFEWLLKNLLIISNNLSLDLRISSCYYHLFLVCPVAISKIFVQTQVSDYWQLIHWPPQNEWNKILVQVSLVLFWFCELSVIQYRSKISEPLNAFPTQSQRVGVLNLTR